MPPVRAVLFDLYGTLAGFDPPREQIQAAAARRHGLELDVTGIASGYREADYFMAAQNATAPLRRMSAGELGDFFARYEQIILRHAGVDIGVAEAAAVWRTVREQEYGLALFPDAIPALDEMKRAGRTVGVVSNMGEQGSAVASRIGLNGHIDFIVTSHDSGANKPHPPIFLEALARASASPEETVLVGDSLGSDIAGAGAVGIRPVFLDRDNRYPAYAANPRITGLGQLAAVICGMERG